MLLNKRNPNGSINLLQVTGENIGGIVSPLHSDFKSQIEDGIWPLVSKLLEKGFYVVDSCQGHWDGENNDYSHFTVAFTDAESAVAFTKLTFLQGVEFSLHSSWINVEDEVSFINKLFLTRHERFIFVNIKILPSKSTLIKKLFTSIIRWRILQRIKRVKNEHID